MIVINRLTQSLLIHNGMHKAQAILKREASGAKELVLQHALAAYQEGLASNEDSEYEEFEYQFNV